ncbi:MAG: hypothetical protein GY838_03880 [bacterium]|nr:hypothetical protein [bacterium]
MKSEELTNTFTARDADGNEYQICEYTPIIELRTLSGDGHRAKGMLRRLETSEGQVVSRIDEGEYEILGGFEAILVTSDDPSAL